MTDPTATTDPPRWRIEEAVDADDAPSAFPMPDGEQGDTACTGEPDGAPDYGDAAATDPALPPQFDPTSVVPLAPVDEQADPQIGDGQVQVNDFRGDDDGA